MSQTIQKKQIKYFTMYAGYCLKTWNSIVGQKITHRRHGKGTVVKIGKFKDGICVEVQFAERRGLIRFEKRGNFVGDRFLKVFTHLTLPREVEKELEIRYWDSIKEDLICELKNLASRTSINQSTFNTFDKIHNRLMTMNQKQKLTEQDTQKINEYQRILMDKTICELKNLASRTSINQSTFNTFDKIHNRLMTMNQKQKLTEQDTQKINEYQRILMDKTICELKNLASHASINQSKYNDFARMYDQLMKKDRKRRLSEQEIQEINKCQKKLIDKMVCELRNLASHASINQSTFNTFDKIYNRLMTMNQKQKLTEQTMQQINGYQKILQKILMGRKRFSDLSEKAMSPDVRAHFPLPELDEGDIQLVGKWEPLLNNLDRTSLIELVKTNSKAKWESSRLLSARSAEKIATYFYRNYGKEVKDVSITQIDKSNDFDWKDYDLDVDGLHVDVKNSRPYKNSKDRYTDKDRYTEHCIPSFKYSRRTNQEVRIAGVFSPYLWPFDLLDRHTERHENAEVLFLGETDLSEQQALKSEFNDLVDFVRPNSSGKFLPPWVFDYPEYVYMERNKALKELNGLTSLASLKGATFKFNLWPISIAAGIDLTEILDDETLDFWERNFLDKLRNRIEKYGLSLPFLFLTILEHFRDMVIFPKTIPNFKPDKYRKFLFYKGRNNPLGIYDPLETIDALIEALSTLWTAEDGLIRRFRVFKLMSFNILQGKSNPNENSWKTLIAYCGGRLEDGSACGKNPLVLGDSELCKECGKLICPHCYFCCKKCREERSLTGSTYLSPTGDFGPEDASGADGSSGYPPH